jgi:hypothetical protein
LATLTLFFYHKKSIRVKKKIGHKYKRKKIKASQKISKKIRHYDPSAKSFEYLKKGFSKKSKNHSGKNK